MLLLLLLAACASCSGANVLPLSDFAVCGVTLGQRISSVRAASEAAQGELILLPPDIFASFLLYVNHTESDGVRYVMGRNSTPRITYTLDGDTPISLSEYSDVDDVLLVGPSEHNMFYVPFAQPKHDRGSAACNIPTCDEGSEFDPETKSCLVNCDAFMFHSFDEARGVCSFSSPISLGVIVGALIACEVVVHLLHVKLENLIG